MLTETQRNWNAWVLEMTGLISRSLSIPIPCHTITTPNNTLMLLGDPIYKDEPHVYRALRDVIDLHHSKPHRIYAASLALGMKQIHHLKKPRVDNVMILQCALVVRAQPKSKETLDEIVTYMANEGFNQSVEYTAIVMVEDSFAICPF